MHVFKRGTGIVTRLPFSWGTDTFNGAGRLAPFMPVNPFFTFTTLLSNGKYYFGAMGLEATLRDSYMFQYNPSTNEIEHVVRVQISGVVTYDIHRMPTISVDGSGNIFMAAEELQTPANGGHASPIRVYKTKIPGEIGSLEQIAVISNRWSYPHIHVDGTTVYIFARGTNSNTFIRGQYWMHKSTNGGTSFASPVKIYDSGDEQKVAYFQRLHDYNNNLYLILNERDNDNFNYTYVAIIKSTDGGTTWTNISGSFSKNIVSVGAITRSEMRTNCMIYETPTPMTNAVNFEGGVVKSDGTVKVLISLQTPTGVDVPTTGVEEVVLDELRFYVYNAGWTYNTVDIPPNMTFYWAADKPTRYINNDQNYDDIVIINVSTRDVSMARSTDNFATQSSTVLLSGSGHSYRMGDMAFNAESEDDYILIIADPVGDPLLWQNEGTTNYTNLRIYKP